MAGAKTVELLLPALPEHVRTARLVVVAVARRAGLQDELVDELRLAVGEACARAVRVNAQHAPGSRIELGVGDDITGLTVTVQDVGTVGPAADLGEDAFGEDGVGDVSLAVLHGLVDELEVTSTPAGGTELRMTWPLPLRPAGGAPSNAAAAS